MRRIARFVAVALGCTIATSAAGYAVAQEREREERREERREVERRSERRVDDEERDSPRREVRETDRDARPQARSVKAIMGTKVSIKGDLVIGTVDDIVFADDGYIDYLVVVNEGKNVIVPWEAAKFNFKEKQATATLDITQERFREAPTVTREQWSTFYEPAYRNRVYTFYGLKPRAERRSILPRR